MRFFFKKYYLVFLALFLAIVFWATNSGKLPTASAGDGDILAVRVYSNFKHLSALDWYNENISSKGSPASIKVDGYEGVRDGLSAYVGAAHVDVSNNNMYSNIYVLSINQEADGDTKEIFSRVLKNWHFNVNLSDVKNAGKCYLAFNKKCTDSTAVADCGEEYKCVSGQCEVKDDKFCIIDSDCDALLGDKGVFCNSNKSGIIHDLRRAESIARLDKYLDIYQKANNGKYPIVGSVGTYVSGKTVSTWPNSWAALSKQLNAPMIVDPINYIGVCTNPKADPVSCWDSTPGVTNPFSMNKNKAFVITYTDDATTPGNRPRYEFTQKETSYTIKDTP